MSATLPGAQAASSARAVLSTATATAAAAATAAAQGATGKQCGQHSFFPTPHLPSSSAVETPGGAAAFTWGSPRAPPAPWPGGTVLTRTLHTVRFCLAAAGPLALFSGGRASSLPRLQESLRPILLLNKRRELKTLWSQGFLTCIHHETQGQTRASASAPPAV